jgi:hypothetical protein
MREALADIRQRRPVANILDFEDLKSAVGFPAYYSDEERYRF